MKKVIIGFILGGGLVYGTLVFQPSLLCTNTEETKDSVSTVASETQVLEIKEISPAIQAVDTAKKDTTKK